MSSVSRKRPWLAVVLALAVAGAGHFYLRRWLRMVGWIALALLTSVLFVPESAMRTLMSANPGVDRFGSVLVDLLPLLAVYLLSCVDAYRLAVENNRRADPSRAGAPTGEPTGVRTESEGVEGNTEKNAETTCPNCGRTVDSELDFCQWCSEPLDTGGSETEGNQRGR